VSAAAEIKRALRREMRARLAGIGAGERAARSLAAARHLFSLPEMAGAGACMAFASMPEEIDTTPILEALWREGWRVALPRIDPATRAMDGFWIDPAQALSTNRWGIPEPEPDPARCAEPAQLALILVPGLAFDARGSRLGRAAGYYDRFLHRAGHGPLRIGLFYSLQQLPEIPTEPWDEPLDLVATDAGILRWRQG
jgi:5-formyltetrahydrofolate cyclo-ligase